MKIKVCHITTVHPANDNRIFHKECKTLSAAGYEVHLLVANGKSEVIDGVIIHGVPVIYKNRFQRIYKTPSALFKAAIKIDAAVYHFHDPEFLFAGIKLRFRKRKVVYDIHENNPASILSKPYLKNVIAKRILAFSFDVIEKFCSRFFSAIATARPDISERFVKQKPVTLRNFPILPDLTNLKPINYNKTKPSVIYVGGMSEIRGTHFLIDAFEKVKAELWLLGPFESDEYETQCKSLSGWKNVKWFGQVGAQEIFSYLVAADIGIITFLPVPNHIKTLATKPFEYMCCGLPMIMSDFKYWKETFGSSSLYVNPADPVDIAKTVSDLFANKSLMDKMRTQNLSLSKKEFNWHSESKKLLELYQNLLSS